MKEDLLIWSTSRPQLPRSAMLDAGVALRAFLEAEAFARSPAALSMGRTAAQCPRCETRRRSPYQVVRIECPDHEVMRQRNNFRYRNVSERWVELNEVEAELLTGLGTAGRVFFGKGTCRIPLIERRAKDQHFEHREDEMFVPALWHDLAVKVTAELRARTLLQSMDPDAPMGWRNKWAAPLIRWGGVVDRLVGDDELRDLFHGTLQMGGSRAVYALAVELMPELTTEANYRRSTASTGAETSKPIRYAPLPRRGKKPRPPFDLSCIDAASWGEESFYWVDTGQSLGDTGDVTSAPF